MMPIASNRVRKKMLQTVVDPVDNEHGAALIMAVIMLVILSILGSVVLMSSDSEMKISGNYQVAKQTFAVADRAVEYATSREILIALDSEIDLNAGNHKTRIEDAGGGVLTEGVIRDIGPGDLPSSLAAFYGTDFGANYYEVSVTAQQTAAPESATVRIDTSIVRIYKTDDDSIFITTGGG